LKQKKQQNQPPSLPSSNSIPLRPEEIILEELKKLNTALTMLVGVVEGHATALSDITLEMMKADEDLAVLKSRQDSSLELITELYRRVGYSGSSPVNIDT